MPEYDAGLGEREKFRPFSPVVPPQPQQPQSPVPMGPPSKDEGEGAPLPQEPRPVPSPPEPKPASLSDIMQRLLNISARDVDYLRGEPYSTTQEQAMRERMQSRVRNVYDQARQRVIDTLGAQQGFSGVLASTLQRLNEAEAAELSGIDRDLMVKAADEMRSRLAESRGIVGGLEALERQRMMESLGLGQMIDESQRARLLDLMAALGLAPPLATAGQAGASLMGYAGQLGQLASLMGQQNLAGLTTLWDLINKMGLVPKP